MTRPKSTRIKTPPASALRRACEFMWSEIVKANAGYVSEISGRDGTLNAHHMLGKSGRSEILRYDTRSGICLTEGEHRFGAHGAYARRDDYAIKEQLIRGEDLRDCKMRVVLQNGTPVRRNMTAQYYALRVQYDEMVAAGRIRESPRRTETEKLMEGFWK